MKTFRILFIGDVVGETGCHMFGKHIDALRKKYKVDALIVNGENSAQGGRGITPRLADFFKGHGANVVTTGNHVWYKREIYSYLAANHDVLRPANFPHGTPGVGVTTFNCAGTTVGVINVQGRVFMREHTDCPFQVVDSLLTYLRDKTKIILVDFHAEATSEKMAMGFHVDGKVSAVVGTHTHVPTADERILPNGTAFISDVGMVGSLNSMLGMKKEPIIAHFLTQLPTRFEVDTTMPVVLNSVLIEVDQETGRALKIERIQIIDDQLDIQGD